VEGGIGMEKGLRVFGRALTSYMHPNTTFSQARLATLRAARDLYGADCQEVRTLEQAWAAVGVK
jgi:bacillolysin